MEKKKESKNGIEVMNLLQVQCYTFYRRHHFVLAVLDLDVII